MGKWPQLILPQFCMTDIEVTVESEDLNENGTPKKLVVWNGKCNYQEKSKRVWTSDKVLVDVSGTCLIPGDIAPELMMIPSGKVTIMGTEKIMIQGTKARNPDGSVNFTQLELK